MNTNSSQGFFEWKRRMGVHQAYHQSTLNRVIHFICIPLQLLGVVKLISLLPTVQGWDASFIFIAVLSPIVLLPELVTGIAMLCFLLGLRAIALELPLGWAGLACGAFLFLLPFIFQTQVGHVRFEPASRDDTEKNISEFLRTKNPIPLLLIFHYHMIELFLLLGYRPALKAEIEAHMQHELAKLNTDFAASASR